MATFFYFFVITLFIILCAVLCLVILIQEGKTTGLGASFGGDAGESVFGTATADVLKKFTAWLAIFFMVACILLSLWSASIGSSRTKSLPTTIEEMEK